MKNIFYTDESDVIDMSTWGINVLTNFDLFWNFTTSLENFDVYVTSDGVSYDDFDISSERLTINNIGLDEIDKKFIISVYYDGSLIQQFETCIGAFIRANVENSDNTIALSYKCLYMVYSAFSNY